MGVVVKIVSTPGTRRICNDPTCCGVAYTRLLCASCATVLGSMKDELGLAERETVVVNILRGGLNFGLREALADAYGWYGHRSGFLSAQRGQSEGGAWYVSENEYRKLYFPPTASIVLGDVVATGTSLAYALRTLVDAAAASGATLRRIVFFAIGGPRAHEVLDEIDALCRTRFPGFEGTTLVYFEGAFAVPDARSPLRIRLPGTDLLRVGATMAPEFVASQYEDPAYPLERCTIYDAGSRAFSVPDFARDVADYWRQTLRLAEQGMTYRELLAERFPSLDAARFGEVDLRALAARQVARMEALDTENEQRAGYG